MMRAVKAVTTNRGRDTRDFVMFAFGGSGGVHAVSLARELRIKQVVVPPAAGVFSALGLLYADPELNESRSFLRPFADLVTGTAEAVFGELETDIAARLERRPGDIVYRRMADLRYTGQAFELSVDVGSEDGAQAMQSAVCERFDAEHTQRYGHNFEGQYDVEIVNLRVVGTVPRAQAALKGQVVRREAGEGQRDAYFGPGFGIMKTAICDRGDIGSHARSGPVIIEEYEGTVVVPPDTSVRLDSQGSLIIELNI